MHRRPVALLSTLLLALAGSGASVLPAHAAMVTDGQCSTETGVTVVVDHQELGGGIVTRCVEDFPRDSSVLEVIRLAGFTIEGTVHDGSSFVCRINGRPGLNESIARNSDPEYRESCVNTPPDDAFWGYWHATNGGDWTFSSKGAGNRETVPGGYEAFSFSLNNATSDSPPPGIAPAHPVSTAVPTQSVEPLPQVQQPHPPRRTTRPTAAPQPAPEAETPRPILEQGGPPPGTYVGLGAVAALGLGGGVVWWRRRDL